MHIIESPLSQLHTHEFKRFMSLIFKQHDRKFMNFSCLVLWTPQLQESIKMKIFSEESSLVCHVGTFHVLIAWDWSIIYACERCSPNPLHVLCFERILVNLQTASKCAVNLFRWENYKNANLHERKIMNTSKKEPYGFQLAFLEHNCSEYCICLY